MNWIVLKTFTTRSEAEVVRGLLESHGIEARVLADDLGGLRPELAFAGGIQLLVKSEDRHEAQLLLMESSDSDDSPDSE